MSIIGGFIRIILGTTRAESMCTATNIFIGQSESPIAIKPFLTHMTSDIDYERISEKLPSNVGPAYDGLVINI